MKPLTLALTILLGFLTLPAEAQSPVPGQPYAIPQNYQGYSPGSLISYSGYNYVIQNNATMLLADTQDAGEEGEESVPVDATAYQIPAGYEDSQPGSVISYGGNDYMITNGGNMVMCNPCYGFLDGTQYQIPFDCAGADFGSVVSYGGFNYLIGSGVMIKIKINVGFNTKPNPGKPGATITGSSKTISALGKTQSLNTGTVVHNTQRPVFPNTNHPITPHPGTVHPATNRPTVGHPQMVRPNVSYPTTVHHQTVHPTMNHSPTGYTMIHPSTGYQPTMRPAQGYQPIGRPGGWGGGSMGGMMGGGGGHGHHR